MKKLFLIAVLAMFGYNANAQVIVNDVDVNQMDVKYIELVGQRAFGFGKLKVIVDYGQEMKMFASQKIKSADGSNAKFNSMVDALNFMDANGWVLVQAMVFPGRTADEQNEVRYLLQKGK